MVTSQAAIATGAYSAPFIIDVLFYFYFLSSSRYRLSPYSCLIKSGDRGNRTLVLQCLLININELNNVYICYKLICFILLIHLSENFLQVDCIFCMCLVHILKFLVFQYILVLNLQDNLLLSFQLLYYRCIHLF